MASMKAKFLSIDNFELAYERLRRGGNKEYKAYYRHLLPSYDLSRKHNLNHLIGEIRSGRYKPSPPVPVFQPKKSGVLRPIAVLQLDDLIVYQAIANVVAIHFEPIQKRFAFNKSFGAILAGTKSPFFFKKWQDGYTEFSTALETAYNSKLRWVAEFDLVSFYELIDHHLLCSIVQQQVQDQKLVKLLASCLAKWTPTIGGANPHHGIPQGPEASAFFAECVLFHFDSQTYEDVVYARYIDDIRLLAKAEIPLRRALIKLDLLAKDRGLVPQAQKIDIRYARKLVDVTNTIPSPLAAAILSNPSNAYSQNELTKMLRRSLSQDAGGLTVSDQTRFKFAISQLHQDKKVLSLIAPLLARRPDLSWHMAQYIGRIEKDKTASSVLFQAIKKNPTFDSAAAHYIDALDNCSPPKANRAHLIAVETANKRSVEQSARLELSRLTFLTRRIPAAQAIKTLKILTKSPLLLSLLIARLLDNTRPSQVSLSNLASLLKQLTSHSHPDVSRYAISLLLPTGWLPTKPVSNSVKILLKAKGVRKKGPNLTGKILQKFFRDDFGLHHKINWKKVLGGKYIHPIEQKCLRLQELLSGDPSARIMILDTFNESLIQALSLRQPTLLAPYNNAAGKKKNPDYGNWLENPNLIACLAKSQRWFLRVHKQRVNSDLAHAQHKSGKPTKAITFEQADRIMKGARLAWRELLDKFELL